MDLRVFSKKFVQLQISSIDPDFEFSLLSPSIVKFDALKSIDEFSFASSYKITNDADELIFESNIPIFTL